jgi:hypothetical protein
MLGLCWDYAGIMLGLCWGYGGVMVGLWWGYGCIMKGVPYLGRGGQTAGGSLEGILVNMLVAAGRKASRQTANDHQNTKQSQGTPNILITSAHSNLLFPQPG